MKKLPVSVNGENKPFFYLCEVMSFTVIWAFGNPIRLSPAFRSLANLKSILLSLLTKPMLWK